MNSVKAHQIQALVENIAKTSLVCKIAHNCYKGNFFGID